MANEDVAFLDARGRARGNWQPEIAEVPHLAAIGAGEPDHDHPLVSGSLDCAKHVATVAACRKCEEHVAFTPVSPDLTREDLVVPIVVADRGKRRRVAMQGQRAQRLAVAEKSSSELGRNMLGVGGRAAIATYQQRAAGDHRACDHTDSAIDVRRQPMQRLGDAEMLVPDSFDRSLIAHFRVHVLTPGSTNVRLASWLPALRTASCTA